MEGRWSRAKHKGGQQHPSFSSTLLDAIYRSIDEAEGHGATRSGGSMRDRYASVAIVPKRSPPPLRPTTERRIATAGIQRTASRGHTLAPIYSSSSSDKSSNGGFSSSSEPDSVAAGLRPIRTGDAPLRSAPQPSAATSVSCEEVAQKKNKKKTGSIRGRFRDISNSRSTAPASPGARIAGFLGSLLSAVAGTPKRAPPSPSTTAASGGYDDSACSTASSHSRSCLIKKPSTRERAVPSAEGEKRTVRFYPVSVIVDEDLRPCGQKSIFQMDPTAETARRRSSVVATEARRRVEELLKGMDEEEEEEEMSDSSSDLFELDNLTVMGGRMDELPVYETTRLDTNRSFSQSLTFSKNMKINQVN